MPLFGRGDDRRERSAADREAARLERERRRAKREGRPLPEEPAETSPSDDAPPDEPGCPTSRRPRRRAVARRPAAARRAVARRAARPLREAPHDERPMHDDAPVHDGDDLATTTSRAGRRSTTNPPTTSPRRSMCRPLRCPIRGPTPSRHGRTPSPTPEPEPVPVREPGDPQSTQPLEPVGAIHARRTVSLPRPQTEELGHHTDSWDRADRHRPRLARRVPGPARRAGMPPHRNIGVQKTRRRWLRRFVVLLVILALAAVAVFAFMLYQPFHGKGYDAVVVRIPPGSSAGDIGDLLSSKDVVESGFFFALRARVDGDRGKLQRRHVHAEAVDALQGRARGADPGAQGGADDRRHAARGPVPARAGAARAGRPACAAATSTPARARSCSSRATYGAPKGTRSLEGFLFPDTYQLRSRTATAKPLVEHASCARSSASSPRSTSSARGASTSAATTCSSSPR